VNTAKPYRRGRALLAGATLVAAAASASQAHAAGLYFSDRGVRPMGRAGAFVAGADDLGAIWYNPAGIVDAGSGALVDFAWLRFDIDYVRELKIVQDGTVTYPKFPAVKGSSPVLPFPTFAGSIALNQDKSLVLAGGVLSPYVALASYPLTVDGQPSPARYTLGSFDGSALAMPGGWISWRPVPQLRVGIGIYALTGWFQTTITFNASLQDRVLGAPEQPEYDATSQMRVGFMFAPTSNAGIIYEPDKHVRFAIAGNLPLVVDSGAELQVRLPTSSIFDTAKITGTHAQVHFEMPAIFRAGIEVRPVEALRVEVAYVRELWSSHDTIVATPKDIAVTGIVGAPPTVRFPKIIVPRGFTDSDSFRVGAEYTFPIGDYRLTARGGMAYEESAVPPSYLSLNSLDFDKTIATVGSSLHIGEHWRLDASYGHVFTRSVYVSPDTASIPRINPLNGNAPMEAVNGGYYSASADLIGVGAEYRF
jgi:long-chain fatty acid transport protein